MKKEELDRSLQDAYLEMGEELRAEVARWDHVSGEAWERACTEAPRNPQTAAEDACSVGDLVRRRARSGDDKETTCRTSQ